MKEAKPEDFKGLQEHKLISVDDEIIQHYPPKYIVGPNTGEERILLEKESDHMIVRLIENECNYLYSNPTGVFNVSLPNKLYKHPNNY